MNFDFELPSPEEIQTVLQLAETESLDGREAWIWKNFIGGFE